MTKAAAQLMMSLMSLTWRQFDQTDWDGFAGAEPLSDGTGPFIAEDEQGVYVLDNRGITLVQERRLDGTLEETVLWETISPRGELR